MSSRAISNKISPKARHFLRPGQAPQPRHFLVRGRRQRTKKCWVWGAGRGRKNAEFDGLAEDEKMPRLRGYIVRYSTRRHRIYNIYPLTIFNYSIKYFGICVHIFPGQNSIFFGSYYSGTLVKKSYPVYNTPQKRIYIYFSSS